MSTWVNRTDKEIDFELQGRKVFVGPGKEFVCSDHLDYAIKGMRRLPLTRLEGSSTMVARSLAHAILGALREEVLELPGEPTQEDKAAFRAVQELAAKATKRVLDAEADGKSKRVELERQVHELIIAAESNEEYTQSLEKQIHDLGAAALVAAPLPDPLPPPADAPAAKDAKAPKQKGA